VGRSRTVVVQQNAKARPNQMFRFTPCPLSAWDARLICLHVSRRDRSIARMRTFLFLAVLLLAPTASAQTLENLHWLRGCWRTSGGQSVITEVWAAPPMPALVGYSYTTRDGQVRGWEQTRIEMIDGAPTFVAMPGGGAAVRFRLADGILLDDSPEHVAVFENPEHDYPQRLRYVRQGNALTATISRSDGGNPIVFSYRRIRCDRALRP
jgi:hypothetical protein